ncbi:MAG: hypothetical protein K2J60_05635, partial [Acetatifactor sp.]|nr:hypothetical protein [Acetatifactor sp.]
DLDGFSNKLGFNKRSFAEWGKEVSQSFDNTGKGLKGLKEAFKTALVAPKKTDAIKLIEEAHFSSIFPVENAKSFFEYYNISGSQSIATLTQWCDELGVTDKTMKAYLVDCMQKQVPASFEGYNNYVQSAIAKSKQLTISAKAGSAALKALSEAGNMIAMWAITKVIGFVVEGFDNLHTTLEEQQEITQNLQGELSEVQSAISDVNSELQATANRIDELNAKDSLSFVEQEELDNLITQNEELERRNKLLAEQEASKQQEIAESVKKEFDKKYVRQTYSRIFLQQEIDEENAKRTRYNELYSNEGYNTSEEVAEMRQLRLELDELNSVDPTASFPEHIQQTIAAYEELNQRKKSGAELTKEEENHLSKYREELITTAVDLDDYSSRYGIDDETNQLWNNLLDSMYECLYPAEHLTEKFNEVFNSLSENVQTELKEAARNGSLSVESLSDNIIDKFATAGFSATEIIEQICSTLEDIESISSNNEPITLFSQLNTSSDSLDKLQSSVKSAADAYATLLSGNYSSTELLDSIQAINQAATDMGSSINWEDIDLKDIDSLDLLGNKLEEVSQKYAESILSGAGIDDSEFSQILTDIVSQMYEAEAEFTGMNAQLDNLQSSYQTLTGILESYNETGHINLDNLQSLLTADENLIAMLEVENGQLVINQAAYENLVAAQLLEFKAKLDDAAAAEIEVLAKNKSEEATNNNAKASEDAVAKLNAETEAFNRNTEAAGENAITKAIADAEEAGVSNEEIQGVLDKYTAIWNAAKDNYSTDFPAFMNGAKSGASSAGEAAGKSAGEAFTEALDKELAALDKKLEAGYIDFNDYIQARLALIKDYYNQGKLSADEYYSYLEKHYDTQLSYMDKVVNAVTRRIDAELDALKQQKEEVENIYKVQIESLEEEKNLLEEANKERQRQKDLQKSLYDLEKARNQRTQLVYTEDKGMHYVADDQSIRDAQENVDNARYDIRIAEIDKSISKLEEARDKETNAIDEMISNLESYKDAWNDVTSAYEEEQENLFAAQILGADWEADILNGRLDVLNAFKNEYIRIQQEIADAALKSANEQAKTTDGGKKQLLPEDDKKDPSTSKPNGGNPHTPLGGTFDNYKKYFAEYASGTNNAKKGLNLVGEDGPEAYFDNHGHVAIVTKPTLIPMEGGEVVKNERDTKKLLDPDNLASVDTASVLTPIQPGSFMWDLQEKFNAYINKMGKDISSVMAPVDSIQNNMARTVNGISPANNITNTGIHQVTIGDIHVTCPGVTSQEVARQVGVELNRQFSGFSLVALQESKK